eukprot:TRINITY_DN15571_c0_g1_i1.p1 TRINITY_DN15571_c0_g1~~TRINITY_DN15571_c0_g1_i1.p1  ORF type:complete len:415 (+),score=79.41 TRINITY_DN15571_c0_g1_i1:73-1317(+)
MNGVVTPYVSIGGDVAGDEVGRIEDSLKLLELERARLSESLVRAKASQASRMSFYVPAAPVAVGLPAATPQLHTVFPGTWVPGKPSVPSEVNPHQYPPPFGNELNRRGSSQPPTPTATRRPAISPTRRQIVTPRAADSFTPIPSQGANQESSSIFQNPSTLTYPNLPVVKPVVTLGDIDRERIVSSHMVYNIPEVQRSREAFEARIASRKVGQIEKELVDAESRAVDAATRFVRTTTTPAMPSRFVDLLDSTPAAGNDIPTLPPSNFAGPLQGSRLATAVLSESSVPSHPPGENPALPPTISPVRRASLPPTNFSVPNQSGLGALPPGNFSPPRNTSSPNITAGITISKANPQRPTPTSWSRPSLPPMAWTPRWWTQDSQQPDKDTKQPNRPPPAPAGPVPSNFVVDPQGPIVQ